MDEVWVAPGRFSRRARLSPKALRIYARDGVLVPARVEPGTGYRHYHIDQLRDARLVRMMRRAGMPIVLIARMLDLPRSERPALLDAYWANEESEFRYRRGLVAHLSRTLAGGKEEYPMFDVKTRDVDAQSVLTEQTFVDAPGLTDWIVRAGMRQIEAAAALGGQSGPRMVIYHGEVSEESDGPVESALPIPSSKAELAVLPVRIESAHREAFVTVTRAQVRYPDIVSAYDAIERWISDSDMSVVGSPREIYFADPSEGPDDEPVADVAFPVR